MKRKEKSHVEYVGKCNEKLCVMHILYNKWIHGKCGKDKRVTSMLSRDFICGRCDRRAGGMVELVEKLCDEVDMVKGFCCPGHAECMWKMYSSCNSKINSWIRWVKFRECGELLHRRFIRSA